MNATFRYVHLDHTQALEEHTAKKLESIDHLIEAYEDTRTEVAFERTTDHQKSGDVFKIHMRLHVNGTTIDADGVGDDLYTLVDTVRDTLHGSVQRYKEQDVARRHAAE